LKHPGESILIILKEIQWTFSRQFKLIRSHDVMLRNFLTLSSYLEAAGYLVTISKCHIEIDSNFDFFEVGCNFGEKMRRI